IAACRSVVGFSPFQKTSWETVVEREKIAEVYCILHALGPKEHVIIAVCSRCNKNWPDFRQQTVESSGICPFYPFIRRLFLPLG
ncbi:MAG: hypothetical protein ACI4W2_10380, partial [Eubacterium sp.]